MTTFKEIRGQLIRTLSSDPTPAANHEGQIWYNTTLGVLKGAALADLSGTWSAGGTANTKTYNYAAAGTQTAAFKASGNIYPPAAQTNVSEEYDGSTWSVGNPTTTTYSNRANGGFGSQTAGVMAGGYGGAPAEPRSVTENYDGTSWTASGSLNTARWRGCAAGNAPQSAGLFNGGNDGSAPPVNCTTTEEYNGTSWTSVTGSSNARRYHQGFGTQTAALMISGITDPGNTYHTACEEYNGSTWTSATSFPAVKTGGIGFGTLTNGVGAGGYNPGSPSIVSTFSYDGSTWTAQGSFANAGSTISGVGTGAAGLKGSTAGSEATEEYTGPYQEVQTKTLTTS